MTAEWPRWLLLFGLLAGAGGTASGADVAASSQRVGGAKPLLRAVGTHLVDTQGRVVILRGVSVSGGAKVPPFLPVTDTSDLDRLPALGMNVIRLVFIWEAFEPDPYGYDWSYLARMRAIADAAWARGLHVIVDIHQDGFSRFVSRGSGDGFPGWAISQHVRGTTPDNGPRCKQWAFLAATDPRMHRSFHDFYTDATGVRTHYLQMLNLITRAFASNPGVIGYDLLNEPWGDEKRSLMPLYEDAAAVVRSVDPTAVLFLEGHITTNCGLQSRLPCPSFDNFVYAPHYYLPSMIIFGKWRGHTASIRHAFANMRAKTESLNCPLILGEFGAPANASRAADYVDYVYDLLDDALASGIQWNFTPTWNPRDKDGWNAEDFNILFPAGSPRANFVARPYPRATAGTPLQFAFHRAQQPDQCHELEFSWDHDPARGTTELYLPESLFPHGTPLTIESDRGMAWRDEHRNVLLCATPQPGVVRLRVAARSQHVHGL
jgi:endoglycosylceramidase